VFVEEPRLESARQVIGTAAPVLTGLVGRGKIYVFTNRQSSASNRETVSGEISKAGTR
jgi:hypothetical protein